MWGIWDIGYHWISLDTFGSHHWLCQVGSEAPGVLATPKARFTLNIRCILRPEMCFSLFVCFFQSIFLWLFDFQTVDGWRDRTREVRGLAKQMGIDLNTVKGTGQSRLSRVEASIAVQLSFCHPVISFYILLYPVDPVVQKACWTFELSKPQVVDSGSHRCYRYRFFVSKLTFRVV